MIKPTVYIDEAFLDLLDRIKSPSNPYEYDKVADNQNQLKNILSVSELNCSGINKKMLIRFSKMKDATFVHENAKDYYFHKALRSYNLSNKEPNLEDSGALFLLDKGVVECEEIVKNNNVMCLGTDSDFAKEVLPKSFASHVIDKEMNGIEKIRHRCKNVILIEPHIFNPTKRAENVPKIPNLIKLLKYLYINNSKVKCHLSIITNREMGNEFIESKIEEISESIANTNLEVSFYAHKDGLFQQNRHIITDYSIMDLQHLFDRDDASISCSFNYDNEIIEKCHRINQLLEKLKNSYDSDPIKFGVHVCKIGDIKKNRLLIN